MRRGAAGEKRDETGKNGSVSRGERGAFSRTREGAEHRMLDTGAPRGCRYVEKKKRKKEEEKKETK